MSFTAACAHAQNETAANYPAKPVTLLAPYSVGGSTNLIARQLTLGLTANYGGNRRLGQANRAGHYRHFTSL